MGPGGAVSEPVQPELLIPAQPDVVALSGDAVVPAGQGHVAGDLLGMPDYRQPPGCVPGYLSFGHKASFVWRPKCQRPVSVSEWCARQESNLLPMVPQTIALSGELRAR